MKLKTIIIVNKTITIFLKLVLSRKSYIKQAHSHQKQAQKT